MEQYLVDDVVSTQLNLLSKGTLSECCYGLDDLLSVYNLSIEGGSAFGGSAFVHRKSV